MSGSSLALCFVDLQKAYDSVPRDKLWSVLVSELGIPDDLVKIVQNMYVESKGVLQKGTSVAEEIAFCAEKGVKQGDKASPELFILYFDRVYPAIQEQMAKNQYTRQ